MKRSINRWTTTLAAAAILGLPVVGVANPRQEGAPQQQPQPAPPQAEPQQPRPTPQPAEPRQPEPGRPQPTDPQPQPTQPRQPEPTSPSTSAAQRDSDETVSPQEHLSQAKQAADSITTTSVPAKSRTQLAELKRHLSALDKSESAPGSAATAPGAASASWGTDVAAIDKIITEMVGGETTGAATASTPGATGTSGSKAAEAVALDDETRSKLMEVRAHITAYAAGKAGATTPKAPGASESPSPGASSQPEASAAQSPASPQSPAPTSGEQAPPPAASPETQPQTPAAGAEPAGAQPQIDVDAARRHLMAARESLSQLTQLPAATQLTGEARTQVAQLISNFNELISAQSNWRASYAKVNSNLNALIGPENGDAEATAGAAAAPSASAAAAGGAQAPATGEAPNAGAAPAAPGGTPGSVGTSGSTTVQIDPAIRAKLVEFRQNLTEFQKASGGAEK